MQSESELAQAADILLLHFLPSQVLAESQHDHTSVCDPSTQRT